MALTTKGASRNVGGGSTWASPILQAGKVWVMRSGVWTPAIGCFAGQTRNAGTLTDPVIVDDWYLQFNNRRPTAYVQPGNLILSSDNHQITETPGDPGKTATVSWNGYFDVPQSYERIRADFYRNGSLFAGISWATDPTTASAGSITSPPIYHVAADDLSYQADTMSCTVYFTNPYADSSHGTGPTESTGTQTYGT